MIVLPDRTVFLNQGETIPVWCKFCPAIYQPQAATRTSRCPKCNRLNWHIKQAAAPVEVGQGE